MYEVTLAPEARAFFEAADVPLARKLARCFERLEQEPRSGNNIKRLAGEWKGYLRYRVGDWRVVYQIDDSVNRVQVLVIAHRREVYE